MKSMQEEFEAAAKNVNFRKEFVYTKGVLSGYAIFSGGSETPLFLISFLINGGKLHSKTILRVSDNKIFTIKYL